MADQRERRIVEIVVDSRQAGRHLRQMDRNLDRVRRSAQGLEASFHRLNSTLGILAGGTVIGAMVGGVIRLSDSYEELRARVGLVVQEHVGLNQTMQDLEEVAIKTYTAFDSVGTLYQRLGVSTKALNLTHEELLQVTTTIADSLRLSGASTKEASSFMLQFSQAMASGVFAGDEFKSASESNVVFLNALADALGVTRGELRKMSEQQELTTETVIDATLNMTGLREQVEQLPLTVSRALTNLTTASQALITDANKTTGAIRGIAEAIDYLAETMRGNTAIGQFFSDMGDHVATFTQWFAAFNEGRISFDEFMNTPTGLPMERALARVNEEMEKQVSTLDNYDRQLELLQDELARSQAQFDELHRAVSGEGLEGDIYIANPDTHRQLAETAVRIGNITTAIATLQERIGRREDWLAGGTWGGPANLAAFMDQSIKGFQRELERAAGGGGDGGGDSSGTRGRGFKTDVFQKAFDESVKAFSEALRQMQAISDAVDPLEPLRRELEEAERLLGVFPDRADTIMEHIIDIHERMEELVGGANESLETQSEIMEDLADVAVSAANSIGDALVDAAFGAEDAFAQMAEGIVRDLARVIVQALVVRPLLESLGGVLGVNLLGSAQGNVFQGGNVVPFAKGGVVTRPTLFPMRQGAGLMGEAGPEAIMPLKRDQEGNLGVAGGINQTLIFNVGGNVDRHSISQIRSITGRETARAVSRSH